jgi:uncharacterized protein
MYQRCIPIKENLRQKSLFLLGPRQTGKSTLLTREFPEANYVNLLAADVFRTLSANPEHLRLSLTPKDKIIIIDEIQKLPSLLDEVQLLMGMDSDLRFILTGSSARKLKRGGANLLAGRAWTRSLHPLVTPELPELRLDHRLLYGSLPSVIDSPDPYQELQEYCGVYLQEEIRAESLTRSIEAFSRFLSVAALSNGEQINFTKVGNDAQVPPRTVREFFTVLEDTLVAFMLPPLQKTKARKPVAASKFYFFDVGVAHALQGITSLPRASTQYGKALEHFIACELRAYCSYHKPNASLHYWRTTSQLEVDFVLNDIAIEVKASGIVSDRDAKSILALGEELPLSRRIIVSNESTYRKLNSGVEVIPMPQFLKTLWAGELIV